jgi:spore coat polysaccharide biosynthesis protein SpsF
MKVLIVVQARSGSTRLPGKVYKPLAGEPVLVRMVERIAASGVPAAITVATTTLEEDTPLVALCEARGLSVFRGHPTDVLDRHYQAGLYFGADAVVKIPSDCPLIDPAVVAEVLGAYQKEPAAWDLVTNLNPPTWPDGNDVEVMRMSALAEAWQNAERPFEREHTTPFIWDNPERFRIKNVRWKSGLDLSQSHRFVLDYPADYDFLAAVYERLTPKFGPTFSLVHILELLEREPELLSLNREHLGKCWQKSHSHELRTLSAVGAPAAPHSQHTP